MMRRRVRGLVRGLGLPMLALLAGAAGPSAADPDWPCVQRLVPVLAAGTLWNGHEAAGDWRSDPKIAALVAGVAPRSRPAEQGAAQLKAFAAALPPAERPATLALVFAGLVDGTNTQRAEIIDRLRALARRQRSMVGTVSRITAELRALPADAPAAEREEVTTRRAFLIRDYEEVERTIRYACEVPVQFEARLGAFAQALQGVLDN